MKSRHLLFPGFPGLKSIGTRLCCFLLFASSLSMAATISFNVLNASQSTSPGGVAVFSGTVTNNTGALLNATDLSFNFFAYNFSVLTPQQLLGNPDFTIPNGATSGTVDLFSIVLGSTAVLNQSYSASVFLQDSSGNESGNATVSVTSGTGTVTPEPGTLFLLGSSLIIVIALKSARQTGKCHFGLGGE